MTRRLIIFASYHPDADLPGYIRYHLTALRQEANRVVFVSNSIVSKAGIAFLNANDIRFLQRQNNGFDFSAWRDVIETTDLHDFDEVVLTNSSIIGPLRSLGPIFAEMNDYPCDFWGLTMNNGGGKKHLQSFFLAFKRSVILSNAWRQWWSAIEDQTDKRSVIRQYETRLYKFFRNKGFVGTSYIEPPGISANFQFFLRKREGIIPAIPASKYWTNATIHSPLVLIREGFPYLKASLLWGHNTRQGAPIAQIKREPGVEYDWSLLGGGVR